MRIEFATELVEDAVFLETVRCEKIGNLEPHRTYHKKVDPLYDESHDDDQRNASFQTVHENLFRTFGLENRILVLISEFPLLHSLLGALVFLKAASRKEEGAELFVQKDSETPEGRTAVVKMRPELILEPESLAIILRRELAHISDMVDPEFDYKPTLGPQLENPAKNNLMKDRYSLLWQAYVDARLQRQGKINKNVLEVHRKSFRRAFASHESVQVDKILEKVWGAPGLKHSDLLHLARV